MTDGVSPESTEVPQMSVRDKVSKDFELFQKMSERQSMGNVDLNAEPLDMDLWDKLNEEKKRGIFEKNLDESVLEKLYADFKADYPDQADIEGDPKELAKEYGDLSRKEVEVGRRNMSPEEQKRLDLLSMNKDKWSKVSL